MKNITILYGSQSGTAENMAIKLGQEAKNQQVTPKVDEIDAFCDFKTEENKLCSEEIIVFIISTYGDGEPTDNALNFYQWLTSKHKSSLLNGVFGCGDTAYEENYNKMGKVVFKRLKELGANPLCPLGLGDDSEDIDKDFDQWKQIFWSAFFEKCK